MELSDSELYERMLNWRDIYTDLGDIVCKDCSGSGTKLYGDTSTWHYSYGGQAMTRAVCDKCWGSGKTNKPWTNLRNLSHESKQ
jgi:hypothetical protein